MKRKTVSLDDELYEAIQRIRAAMISSGQDVSFTGTLEMIAVSGILSAKKMDERIFREMEEFMKEDSFSDMDRMIDDYMNFVLARMRKLQERRRY